MNKPSFVKALLNIVEALDQASDQIFTTRVLMVIITILLVAPVLLAQVYVCFVFILLIIQATGNYFDIVQQQEEIEVNDNHPHQ